MLLYNYDTLTDKNIDLIFVKNNLKSKTKKILRLVKAISLISVQIIDTSIMLIGNLCSG